MSDSSVESLPLHGVRVVEVTDSAELCGRYLADLGAEVIKVEPPGGARSRHVGVHHNGVNLSFAVENANKQSVVLDFEDPDDVEAFLDLLASADVWIESSPSGTTPSIGMPVTDIRARLPHLVIVSVSDFGQTGPYRDWSGNSWIHTAMSGFLSRSGIGEDYPLMPPVALPAKAAPIQAAWGALVGLWQALETGQGDHIDVSLLEATGQIVDPAMGMVGTASSGADVATTLTAPRRGRPDLDMYPIFECSDGFVRVVMLSPRQWKAMRAWLGDPQELMASDLEGIFGRFASAELIRAHITSLFRDKSKMEIVAEGQARGVPCAPVLTLGDVINTAHFAERGAVEEREIAPDLRARVPSGFIDYNGHRLGIRERAPELGKATTGDLLRARPGHLADSGRTPDRGTRRRPLAGVRVLDLGVIVYGAEAGRLFADLGADVIKVENRAYPDGARVARGGSMNANFVAGHRGKRSVGLNLRTEEGRALFLDLVAKSDVVLANFKPGTLESLDLGYEDLNAANPRVVLATSSAMGSSGPWANWMGYGPLVRCVSGLTSLWRYPERTAAFADGSTVYPDHFAARVMACAVLAAMIARRHAGVGVHIEGAQAEAILVQLSELIALESLAPGTAVPAGNESTQGAPWGVFPCVGDDEWCVITVRSDAEWERFCEATGLSELAGNPEFVDCEARLRNHARLNELVARWTYQRSPAEVQWTLQAAGVPAGAMIRPVDLASDAQLQARDYLITISQPGLGEVVVENAPFFSERIETPRMAPAPDFGQHTREVLGELLGLGGCELDHLRSLGVIEETSTAESHGSVDYMSVPAEVGT